jgi:hypothetical protein
MTPFSKVARERLDIRLVSISILLFLHEYIFNLLLHLILSSVSFTVRI